VVGAAHLSLSLVTHAAPAPIAGAREVPAPAELSSSYPDYERVRSPSYPAGLPLALAELERLAITEALRRMSGNRTHAARLLGIGLRTLRNKLRAYRETGVEVEPAGAADGQDWPGGTTEPPGISQSWHAALRARASHGEDS
jgi:DNA-binding NtrC family response regulator